jgi:hypothetical protein
VNLNHYRAIARKELYQILRDPGTLILLTLGPVFLLLVFVFMLTSDVRDVPTAVVDLSNNDASQHLIDTIEHPEPGGGADSPLPDRRRWHRADFRRTGAGPHLHHCGR